MDVLAVMDAQIEEYSVNGMPEARAAVAELIEALRLYELARDELFSHCISNGVFNAWGAALDCTALNRAHLTASAALARASA